jgi:hypothetical protein
MATGKARASPRKTNFVSKLCTDRPRLDHILTEQGYHPHYNIAAIFSNLPPLASLKLSTSQV